MEATRGRPLFAVDSWEAAERLAEEIAAGQPLPELVSPVVLEVGEVLHATGEADAWREQMAAPQWRPLGQVPVMATGQRPH